MNQNLKTFSILLIFFSKGCALCLHNFQLTIRCFRMNRKESANALLSQLVDEYPEIEKLYKESLEKKEIDEKLRIKVKHYLEDARSALDYVAHDIAASIQLPESVKVHFPVVGKTDNNQSFEGGVGRNLNGLKSDNPILYAFLESIQPYHQGYGWLGDFCSVTNDIKHQDLTPQIRHETEYVSSTHSGGGMVAWNPAAVKFGSGVFINGAPVNPATQMPMPTSETTVVRERWVDFLFLSSISALPLLGKLKADLSKIIEKVYENLAK